MGTFSINSRMLGYGALTLMLFSSGTYNAFAKLLTNSLSPLSLVFISEVFIASSILFSYGIVPVAREFFSLKWRELFPLLTVGLASAVFAPTLLYFGLHRTSAVNTTFFANTEMLFLLLLAALFLHERLRAIHIASITLILTGLFFIALRGFCGAITLHPGDMIVLLSSFLYAIGGLFYRKYLIKTNIHLVIFARAAVAIVCFLLFALFFPLPLISEVTEFPLALLPVLLGFVMVSRLFNITCFYEALERLPVSTMSLLSNLAVLTSIGFSCWFLGESLTSYQVIGGTLVLGGAFLIELTGNYHPSPEHHRAHMTQRRLQGA